MAQSCAVVGQVRAQPPTPVKATHQSDTRFVATSCVAGPAADWQIYYKALVDRGKCRTSAEEKGFLSKCH